MRRLVVPLTLLAAALVAAGGYIHLREWIDVYRNVPDIIPGANVVKIGFPLNAAGAAVVAMALVFTAYRLTRYRLVAVGAAVLFEAGSLAALVASRTGTFLGWSEPGWTASAQQTLVVGIAALVVLVVLGVISVVTRSTDREPRVAVGKPIPVH